ncbi:hypothetical protein [Hyalangium sp.]|uniref:hypothetical protein n=1 Tax=Hyalangium sp. TaxID=2028555 RepID=UPI002D570294|nr:hypothetical protein [Hyalangium sp.]HYH96400.1 hypothetical protein [Hyalangium sp.]
MKLKSILAAVVLMSALTASDAIADANCSLNVNPSSYITLGQFFSFSINIQPPGVDFSPLPPYWPPTYFTVVFHGSKNGVADIPPSGEGYPGTVGYGTSVLTGFQNPPSGGISGTYLRYAQLYDNVGRLYCVTNTIAVVLQ